MKIGRGLKLLVLGLAGLLLAATSGSGLSGFETPSVPQPQLEGEWIQGLRFSADERWQALRHQERDYYGLGAFERLSPNMREKLLIRERAWDSHWGATGAAQQVDLSKISPVVQIAAFQDKMAFGPGSGTLIHPSGLILTNSHVVRKGPGGCGTTVQGDLSNLFVVLITEEGKEDQPPVPKFTAVLVAEDPQLDVALLEIKQQVDGLKNLKELKEAVAQGRLSASPLPAGLTLPHWNLWDSRVLKEESRVLAWGYPEDKPGVELPRLELSRGPIFTLRPPEGPQHLFIDKLFTIPGISGGPVVDPKTDLIVGVICGRGIPTKPAKPAEELTKAILVNEIQDLLKKAPQRINYYPVADFTWSPPNPKVGDVVTFDASLSFDFDGSIAHYEWDFNGDGKPDATGKQASFKVPSLEDLRVMLTVKDNEGASNSQIKRVILQREQTCKVRIGEREFTSIREAIEKAKAGDTITIFEGQCQEDVVIAGKQGLTLKGAGRDKTTLFGTGTAPVITIQASRGITIECLTIRDGLVGLLVQNSSDVIIRQNAVMQNLGRGISLMDASGVKIEQNVIEANGEEGLQVRGAPKGEPVEVRENEIRRNEEGGVLIRETVGTQYTLQVKLIDNKIEENKLMGMAITHLAAAEISGGRIADTREVKGQFGTGLEINGSQFEAITVAVITVSGNKGAGIVIKGQSGQNRGVAIIRAIISSNRFAGLEVRDFAIASIAHCQVLENGGSVEIGEMAGAILVVDSAQAEISDSTISANAHDGLHIMNLGRAKVSNSVFYENDGRGILVWDSAQADITYSTVSRNGLHGIELWEQAQLNISHSIISKNMWDGISVSGFRKLNIAGNIIYGNAGCGISCWWYYSSNEIQGEENQMSNNAVDICGNMPSGLRMPLVEATENEIVYPNAKYVSLQEAVDALLPRGRLILLSGEYYSGLTIDKELQIEASKGTEVTLQGGSPLPTRLYVGAPALSVVGNGKLELLGLKVTGEGHGLALGAEAQVRVNGCDISGSTGSGVLLVGLAYVEITNSTIAKSRYGISIQGSARATIIESAIRENWWSGINLTDTSQAVVRNSTISENSEYGVGLMNSAQVQITKSILLKNDALAIFLVDSTYAMIVNSTISETRLLGIRIEDAAQVVITDSKLSNNGNGIDMFGSAQAKIRNSTIESNGTDERCKKKGYICNGILVAEKSQVKINGSKILSNTDWGVGAWLKQCGYKEDDFIGQVIFEGTNLIVSNNTSGNQNGMGNPGNHPWNRPDVPDGQVCLP